MPHVVIGLVRIVLEGSMASTRKRSIRSTLRSSDTKLGTPVQISTEDDHHVYVGGSLLFFPLGLRCLDLSDRMATRVIDRVWHL